MKRSSKSLATLLLLLIAVPGCVGDDVAEEEPQPLVESLVAGIPFVPLGVPLEDVQVLPEETEYMVSYEVPGATDYFYQIEAGRLMVTTLDGLIQRVIYQTPMREDLALQKEKNETILAHYAGDLAWEETEPEEGGILYRRSDGELFAYWHPDVDYMTVGTVAFREAGGL